MLLKAYSKGGQQAQQAILTEILKGFHELEQDIGDPEVLAGYADKTGLMSREEVGNACCSFGRSILTQQSGLGVPGWRRDEERGCGGNTGCTRHGCYGGAVHCHQR